MAIFTIDELVEYCRADGDDNAVLQRCLDSAVAIASKYCNRTFYETQAEADAAQATSAQLMMDAITEYNALVDAAKESEDIDSDMFAQLLQFYQARRDRALDAAYRAENATAIDDAVAAAILLITGHLYENRTDVIVGQGAAAVRIPGTSAEILDRYVYLGRPNLS